MGSCLDTFFTIMLIVNSVFFLWEWVPIIYYIKEFYKENSVDAMWLLVHVFLLTILQASIHALILNRILRPSSHSKDHELPRRRRRLLSNSRSWPSTQV